MRLDGGDLTVSRGGKGALQYEGTLILKYAYLSGILLGRKEHSIAMKFHFLLRNKAKTFKRLLNLSS